MVVVGQVSGAPVTEVGWLIPLFPLVGAIVLLAFGGRLKRASGPLATAAMVGSFVVGMITLLQVSAVPAGARVFVNRLSSWLAAGPFEVAFDYRIDPLTIVMVLVVTGVGGLIHLYSVGYMRDDPREGRYFAYLNLFAFSMLVLVMANNFLVLYLGWELVGLCSYLLIGFWFERPEAGPAAKKAFVTNRVGDVSFAIGIFLIFATFGSLDFAEVFSRVGEVPEATVTAIALLLFGGAIGKSAQFPLHVWLPDAMAGPTPVSALIHAATMVTAGVYMVARTHILFDFSTIAGDVVAAVGIGTALFAAVIALVQDDIKRVLAYSTISQLGFMFVGVGVGAYSAGVYHLVTHAFFKALLFLGAGSVMHALAGRTDITRMGGLGRRLPWTAFTFVLGWLAIVGFPGTSGFFSKDQILEGAYGAGSDVVWILGLVGAGLTGLYMTRLVWLTFFGRSRDPDAAAHAHESPPSMVFPLVVLAAAATLGGLLGASPEDGRIQRFIGPTVGEVEPSVLPEGGPAEPAGFPHREGGLSAGALSGIATAAGLGGAALGLGLYAGGFDWRRRRERPSLAWRAARNKLFVDDVYGFAFTSAGRLAASAAAYVVDLRFIDGAVNGIGTLTARLASLVRRVQTGFVRSYALGILAGAVLLVGLLLGRTVIR